ncbi:MAG: hypothetical protein ACKV22_26780 [Bryobacteraceae bacterium]
MWRLLSLSLALTIVGQAFSPALDDWRKEIEAAGATVNFVNIVTDPVRNEMRIEGEVRDRALLVSYLANERFRGELVNAHALTISQNAGGRSIHFIVFNMAREAEWRKHEEGLVAHELGHVWLQVRGFAGVPYVSGKAESCLAIHVNDVVQHVIIRAEMARRGIDGIDYWLSKLLPLISDLESGAAAPVLPPCRQAALLSHWLDARLGTAAEDWDKMKPVEQQFSRLYPLLAAAASEVESEVRRMNPASLEGYEQSLRFVRDRFNRMYDLLAAPKNGPSQSPL